VPSADDLDETVRRADTDRWLASRFVADPAARADLVALYAFDLELDRARRITSNPLTAEIRLTWWWEALGEIFVGGVVRAHPLAMAIGDVVARRGLPRDLLEAMIDARLEVVASPVLDEAQALRWADLAGGSVAVLGAGVLDPEGRRESARPAGRLIALGTLVRQGRLDPAAGRVMIRRILPEADRAARTLSASAFPAVAAAVLGPGGRGDAGPSELRRRLRLAWAVARGRLQV
jgi:phytoene synthase